MPICEAMRSVVGWPLTATREVRGWLDGRGALSPAYDDNRLHTRRPALSKAN